ncbi:MAG: Rne/Rng family ribonuclease, partial [Mariprofundaceae bacterium]
MKKKIMLIEASHAEVSRVAIVEDGYLQELDIESAQRTQTKNNIYKGTITKVEASLQAAFVEYGSERQGFLPLNEIHTDYWRESADKSADPRRVNIQDVVDRKQSVLVQVVKEERGNKGAALTTIISLAGRYLVLSPNDPRGGISRKLTDADRRAMKELLAQLDVPEQMGLIVRTAGKDQSLEQLQRDFSYLRRLWDDIHSAAQSAPSPSLIYLDGDLATRAIRDHFSNDISEIWIDEQKVYRRTKEFVHSVLPGKEKLVKLYRGKIPLFRHHDVESQSEEVHEREIRLTSGGAIVFDTTEALTSVDVNSSRSTGEKHIDDTALATNLEAAREIARQLRIRDIGGLIVIDFIDMVSRKHSQQIEEVLRDACKKDKARIQFARISRFGLLEMSRQRLHPSVRETTTEPCPRCLGRGRIRVVESMALQVISHIEDFAAKGCKPILSLQLPMECGEYIMNNKRGNIGRIESLYDVQILTRIREDLVIPHYRIERQWMDGNQARMETLADTTKISKPPRVRRMRVSEPIVGVPACGEAIAEAEEATTPIKARKSKGLIGMLTSFLRGADAEPKVKQEAEKETTATAAAEATDETQRPQRRRRSRGGRRRRPNQTGARQRQATGESADKP